MNISQKGIDLIKKYEGCRLQSYLCPAGIWTIGYGHTGGDVFSGKVITQPAAEDYLINDLKKFETQVTNTVKLSLNQSQFDALVSFTYNCGLGNLKLLTANRNHTQIANAIILYNKSAGKVLNGLVKRRAEEQQLFLSETSGNGTEQSERGIMEYSLKNDGEKNISANFKVKEFKCKDNSDKILVDIDFVKNKLQAIRNQCDVAVTINSAYRTESYNKKIGGAAKSYHLTGQAFDIVVKGKTPAQVAKSAQSLGITGIIQYNTFVHIDSRATKYWARDNNGKVTIVSNF